MTHGVNISSSYASPLPKSIRDAKAMEGENSQPQDVKVQLHFIFVFAYISSF